MHIFGVVSALMLVLAFTEAFQGGRGLPLRALRTVSAPDAALTRAAAAALGAEDEPRSRDALGEAVRDAASPCTRRGALARALAGAGAAAASGLATRPEAALAAAGIGAQRSTGTGRYMALETADEQLDAIRALRAALGDPNRSSKSKRKLVKKASDITLQPLLQALSLASPDNSFVESLSPEQQLRLRALPVALKGHLAELAAALDTPDAFTPFVSAATQRTYAGGVADRELEEVDETVVEFLALAGL